MRFVLLFLFFIAVIQNSPALSYDFETQFQLKEESTKRQFLGEFVLNTDVGKIFCSGNYDVTAEKYFLGNYGFLFSKDSQIFIGKSNFSGVMSVLKNPQTLTVSALKTGITQAKPIQFSRSSLTSSLQPFSLFFSFPVTNNRGKLSLLWQLESVSNLTELEYHNFALNYYQSKTHKSNKTYFVFQQSATLAFFPYIQQRSTSWFLNTPFVQNHVVSNLLYQVKLGFPKIQIFSNFGLQNSAWQFLCPYNKTEILIFFKQGKIMSGFFVAQDSLYKTNGNVISKPFTFYINPQFSFIPKGPFPLRVTMGLVWQNENTTDSYRLQEKLWGHKIKFAADISSLYFDITGNVQVIDVLKPYSVFCNEISQISSSMRISFYPRTFDLYQKISFSGESDFYPEKPDKNRGEISGLYKIGFNQVQFQGEIALDLQETVKKIISRFSITGKNLFGKLNLSFFTDKDKKTTGVLSVGYKKSWKK